MKYVYNGKQLAPQINLETNSRYIFWFIKKISSFSFLDAYKEIIDFPSSLLFYFKYIKMKLEDQICNISEYEEVSTIMGQHVNMNRHENNTMVCILHLLISLPFSLIYSITHLFKYD